MQIVDLSGKLIATATGRLTSFSQDGQLFATTAYSDRKYEASIWDFMGNKKGDYPKYAQNLQTGASFVWANDNLKLFPPTDYSLTSFSPQKLLPDTISLHTFSEGDPGIEYHVSLSPDGKWVSATSRRNFEYKVWDRSGNVRAIFPKNQQNRVAASFSSDSKYLATAHTDGTAAIWDLKPRYRLSLNEYENRLLLLKGHKDQLYHIKFSPQGDKLLTTSRDGTTRLWRLKAHPVASIDELNSFKYAGSFAGPQKIYAAGYSSIKCHGASTDLNIDVKGYFVAGLINSVAISPRENFMAKTDHQELSVLDVDGNVLFQQPAHESDILSLEFSSDGNYVVTSDINDVKVWDLTGKEIAYLPGKGGKGNLVFQPQNKPYLIEQGADLYLVIEKEGEVIITDMTDREVARFQGTLGNSLYHRHIFSQGYEHMVLVAQDDSITTVKIVDLENLAVTAQRSDMISHGGAVFEKVKFATDHPGYVLATEPYSSVVKVWNWEQDTVLSLDTEYQLNSASISTQTGFMVTHAIDNIIRFWDLNGEELFRLENLSTEYVDFSQDGQYLIVGEGSKVEFWPLKPDVLIGQARSQGIAIPSQEDWLKEMQ